MELSKGISAPGGGLDSISAAGMGAGGGVGVGGGIWAGASTVGVGRPITGREQARLIASINRVMAWSGWTVIFLGCMINLLDSVNEYGTFHDHYTSILAGFPLVFGKISH
jgi:hypothetical protein